MDYYLDTEFIEGPQKKWPFRKTKPTIDLISLGLVCEDGREYYAISKDFNLKEAWNRYDRKINKKYPMGPEYLKVYWIRENVLKPIFQSLFNKSIYDKAYLKKYLWTAGTGFNYNHLKALINWYGQSNTQIASEVIRFVMDPNDEFLNEWLGGLDDYMNVITEQHNIIPNFYTYYGGYDWVVFCWLFGKMIDLPTGFPMYSKDLKQIMDEVENNKMKPLQNKAEKGEIDWNEVPRDFWHNQLKNAPGYPEQEDEHNALADARWNKKLHEFLKSL